MIHVKKSAQSLLVFMFFAGLSPVVSTASQPSEDATNQLKKHKCSWPGCIKAFTKKYALTKHMKIHTGTKPFQCQTCNKKFVYKCNLITHMKIHTGTKPFQCQTCNQKFTYKCNLITHMSIHTGTKPFQCQTCNQKFTQRSNLKRHMSTHTGTKPFQCQRCNQKFARNNYLRKHLKRKNPCKSSDPNSLVLAESPHEIAELAAVLDKGTRQACSQTSSELVFPELPPSLSLVVSTASQLSASATNKAKKHACSWYGCTKMFACQSDLTRHIRTHTGEKPFQCQKCNQRFVRNEHLKIHLNRKNQCKPSGRNSPTLAGSPGEIAVLATALDQAARQARNQVNSEIVVSELLPSSPVQDHVERSLNLESYLYQPLQLDFKNKGILPAGDPMDVFPDVDFHNEDNFQLGKNALLLHFQPKSHSGSDLPLPVSTNNDF